MISSPLLLAESIALLPPSPSRDDLSRSFEAALVRLAPAQKSVESEPY